MVIRNLINKELFQLRWILIVGLLFNVGTAVLLVTTFNYLAGMVTEIPGEMIEMLAQYEVTRELLYIFEDYTIYVWSQWHAKNLFQIGALVVIIITSTQFAGEVGRGTISFYLTRPVSRIQGLSAKVASGVLLLGITVVSGIVVTWLISLVVGINANWALIFSATLLSFSWIIAYYLIGCVVSILNREPITAGVITGLVGIILSLPGFFPATRFLSLFYQMRATDYVILGGSFWPNLGISLVLNALIFIIACRIFKAKDF
jgi:ABC-type transport system involved in multi-copper enzyme maturation permease subunit